MAERHLNAGAVGVLEWKSEAYERTYFELLVDIGERESNNARVIDHVVKVHDESLASGNIEEAIDLQNKIYHSNLALTYLPINPSAPFGKFLVAGT